ncbi:TonB-dependent receptor plug domain-containing protein [Vacuolonema iberomarrocanum]|uniref:TonB-dependent receptor plug domain-containing protein n=1 Tax=Vacuolonema iberomarrocanum TaxID=3454632 RepID=UPI003F6E26E1
MGLFATRHRFNWKQCSSGLVLCLAGFLLIGSTPSRASEALQRGATEAQIGATQNEAADAESQAEPSTSLPSTPTLLSEFEQPATTVEEWAVQIAQSQVTITGVRVDETEADLQIVLDTAGGELSAPSTQTVGNALIVEIPNAVLDLPESELFEQFDSATGIALIRVTNMLNGRVQVSITGTDAPPQAEVSIEAGNLVLSVEPGVATAAGADEDAIQVVVTGEEDDGYFVPDASTATRTNTPLRDIPQSIQVVPRQVIEDQGIVRIGDALRNVSGVTRQRDRTNASDRFTIRGFDQSRILRNGFRTGSTLGGTLTIAPNTVERIEVLKGPASVIFGQVEPGGVVNFVTE